MLQGVGQGEITALCLLQCRSGCVRPHGCRKLSNIPVPSLLTQVWGSSGQKARLKMSGFPYTSLYAFFPNLLPLFPSTKAWLVIYRRQSKPGPARESSHVFASRAVSWYISPWRPWRSDLLYAHGSGTWRLSQTGSWETLFLHAPQHREAWRQTQPGLVRGLTLTRELLLAAPNTPRAMLQGAPAPLGAFCGGVTLSGSGKLTASLCSILSESFLHLLLSPQVKCMQIKHGW